MKLYDIDKVKKLNQLSRNKRNYKYNVKNLVTDKNKISTLSPKYF